MPLVLFALLIPIVVLALTPLLLIQRYRAGKARRQARSWVATLNVGVMAFSAVFFLISAAFTAIWIPDALKGAALGMLAGFALGLLGLLLTRWEFDRSAMHYTPNSWLVLLITLIVAARLIYGLVRSAVVAQAGVSGAGLVTAFGVPQSLAAGGTVIGYYFVFNAGLRWRVRRNGRR